MDQTLISWTDKTWNPWTGCTKVSAGCKNCYMFTGQRRWGGNPAIVRRTSHHTWRKPVKWQHETQQLGRRLRVFTCSWSDWFHPAADPWRAEAWETIRSTPDLDYQILTKRPELIVDRLPADWGDGWPNVWLGVSVENQEYAYRAEQLAQIAATVRFVSYEPALGPLVLDLNGLGINWMIYGGESGPGFRAEGEPGDPKAWARSMRDQCISAGAAFFHKQSAASKTERGVELDGKLWHQMP